MELPSKRLRQQRAALGARQGDPESPASGTLYARRRRLAQELESIETEQPGSSDYNPDRSSHGGLSVARLMRSAIEVQRDLQALDAEIEDLQQQIDDIDRMLIRCERKGS